MKQKERKKQELERQVFNADQFEDGPPTMSMVNYPPRLGPQLDFLIN